MAKGFIHRNTELRGARPRANSRGREDGTNNTAGNSLAGSALILSATKARPKRATNTKQNKPSYFQSLCLRKAPGQLPQARLTQEDSLRYVPAERGKDPPYVCLEPVVLLESAPHGVLKDACG